MGSAIYFTVMEYTIGFEAGCEQTASGIRAVFTPPRVVDYNRIGDLDDYSIPFFGARLGYSTYVKLEDVSMKTSKCPKGDGEIVTYRFTAVWQDGWGLTKFGNGIETNYTYKKKTYEYDVKCCCDNGYTPNFVDRSPQ